MHPLPRRMNMLFRFLRLGSVLACLSACIQAQSTLAQSPESALLGGPCAAGREDTNAKSLQHGTEVRQGNREAALALTRQIVRLDCSNEYWWLLLAEELVQSKQPEQSVLALESLYARKSNAVEYRLNDPASPLHQLPRSQAYQRSHLAAELDSDRRALAQRRLEAKAKLLNETHPPVNYVATGSCPFECCRFGRWSVMEETKLFESPAGSRIVGSAHKGQKVEGLTGELHLHPVPVRVHMDSPYDFRARDGDVVFLLNPSGEGYGEIWIQGRIASAEVASVGEICIFPNASCWGEFVNPEDANWEIGQVWWVKIKTANGVVGWTKQTQHFGGVDRCGA
jgi:hypothetical protein